MADASSGVQHLKQRLYRIALKYRINWCYNNHGDGAIRIGDSSKKNQVSVFQVFEFQETKKLQFITFTHLLLWLPSPPPQLGYSYNHILSTVKVALS